MKEEYLSIETLEKINKLQKELDKAINKKETLKGGLDDVYRKSYYDLKERINKAIEYIENNDLYTQDIDYDYDDNMVLSPPTDELERKELLNILKGEEDKVEIKEDTPKEDKKIEKLNANGVDFLSFDDIKFKYSTAELEIVSKINEIIDRLNGEDNE